MPVTRMMRLIFFCCSATLLLSSQRVQAAPRPEIQFCIKTLKSMRDPSYPYKLPFEDHVPALLTAISAAFSEPSSSAELVSRLYSIYPDKTVDFLTRFSQSGAALLPRYWAYTRITKLSRHPKFKAQERKVALEKAEEHVQKFLGAAKFYWTNSNIPSNLIPFEEIGHSELSLFAANSLTRLYSLNKARFREKIQALKILMDVFLSSGKKIEDYTENQRHVLKQLSHLAELLAQNTQGQKYLRTVLEIFSQNLTPHNPLALDFLFYWRPKPKDGLASDEMQSLLKKMDELQAGRIMSEAYAYQGPVMVLSIKMERLAKLRSLITERIASGSSTLVQDLEITLLKAQGRDFTRLEKNDLLLIALEISERASSDAGIAALIDTPKFTYFFVKVMEKLADEKMESLPYAEFIKTVSEKHFSTHLSRFHLLTCYLFLFEKCPKFWKALQKTDRLKTLVTKIAADIDSKGSKGDHYGRPAVNKALKILISDTH